MSARTRRIACVDFGASEGKIEVLDYWSVDGVPMVALVQRAVFATTKGPNNPELDYAELRHKLGVLQVVHGFDAIGVGIAARVRPSGVIAPGGSLNWAGYNLKQMLEEEFGVPVRVANDGVMFAAYELVFGVLADPKYRGRSFLTIVPGTGIGTSLGLWTGDDWMLIPGEGQHNLHNRTEDPTGCNCGGQCFESKASGVMYERLDIDPAQLSEAEDVATMAPVLGALVATYMRIMPMHLDLVVVSGRVAIKRPSLVKAIQVAADADLRGHGDVPFVEVPEVLLGSNAAGGTQGGLAEWILSSSTSTEPVPA